MFEKQYFLADNDDIKTTLVVETFENGVEVRAGSDDSSQVVVVRLDPDQVEELAKKLGVSKSPQLVDAAPDLLAACEAFVEAWEKSLQLEKTDVALRMVKMAIEKARAKE
jgi:ABC-type amino acid transport substrate-binding protein